MIMADQLRNRAELQLISSTLEEMSISIMTYFMHPEMDFTQGREPVVSFRITSTAVIKSVNPAESRSAPIYRLRKDHDRAPEFSHLVGEPIVEKQ